jgi:hypothetical protein
MARVAQMIAEGSLCGVVVAASAACALRVARTRRIRIRVYLRQGIERLWRSFIETPILRRSFLIDASDTLRG